MVCVLLCNMATGVADKVVRVATLAAPHIECQEL